MNTQTSTHPPFGLAVDRVDFAKGNGLVPAIVQHAGTGMVLMLAYMDRAALEETLDSAEATFFSRSRNGRWRKGESSGHRLRVTAVALDCDGDTLLLQAEPLGPTCHLGTQSCFGAETPAGPLAPLAPLARLEGVIAQRADADPETSGTARLLARGVKRIAQKVGEEGVECALAAVAGPDEELANEIADLFYHVAVLCHARRLPLSAVMDVLATRSQGR